MDIKRSSVQVAYADPVGVFPEFQEEFRSYLHLTNLHWNPGDRPLRTIPRLDVDIVPLDNDRLQHQLLGLSDTPFVQIMFVEAETADFYRGKLRNVITRWQKQIAHLRDPTGWLVVHYVNKGRTRSKSVWTKLCADFNSHVAQIYLDIEHPQERREMWARFIAVFKAEILSTFSLRVSAYEEEVRKLQSTRDVVGWNFGTLFVMKEGLARSFEKLNFLEDAFQSYVELERMAEVDFFENKEPRTIEYSMLESDYHDMAQDVLEQKSSLFDFYRYIYSRETVLLIFISELSSTASIANQNMVKCVKRALLYIPKLANILAQQGICSQKILEWEYRAACDIYQVLLVFAKNIANGRGELLLLQRDTLRALADVRGWHIKGVYHEIELEEENSFDILPTAVLTTEAEFVEKYFELTHAAIEAFQASGAHRSVNALLAQLALIEYAQENYSNCWDLLESMPSLYTSDEFGALSADLHSIAVICAKKLGKVEHILRLSWSLLQLDTGLSDSQAAKSVLDIQEYADLEETEVSLEKWFDFQIHPFLRGDKDYFLEVELRKKTVRPFLAFDTCAVTASVLGDHGPVTRNIVFKSASFDTQQHITLRCKTRVFVDGTVILQKLTLRCKKQLLVKELPRTLVRMLPLDTCLHAEINLSKILTTKVRHLELQISSPEAITAEVSINSLDGLELQKEKQKDTGLKNFKHALVTIPAVLSPENLRAGIRVIIKYDGDGWFEFVQEIDLSLLVLIQVQEFYRHEKIINHFVVDCNGRNPVMITQAQLKGSKWFSVERGTVTEEFTAFDRAPVSYVFVMTREDLEDDAQNETQPNEGILLSVTHRLARWECEELIFRALTLDGVIRQYSSVVRHILRSFEFDQIEYTTTQLCKVDQQLLEDQLSTRLKYIDPQHLSLLKKAVRALPEALPRPPDANFENVDVILEVGVPDPDVDIVSYVSLSLEPRELYVVGEPIKADLTITTDSRWSRRSIDPSLSFNFEIDRNCDGWTFMGVSRGKFQKEVHRELTLIPYKAGKLFLPTVQLQTAKGLTMEVVVQQASQWVQVIPLVNKLTITF